MADGWTLRNKIVWHKPNPRPSSVRDRLACAWELVYVFTRQPNYFFDLDAIRRPHRSRPARRGSRPLTPAPVDTESWRGPNGASRTGLAALRARGLVGHPLGANPTDVWTLAPARARGGHHATFPATLAERAVRAGCPERRCRHCHAPSRRPLTRTATTATRGLLTPTCACDAPGEPGIVLDPFFGIGSTGMAAAALERDWLGIELNPAFADLARQRLNAEPRGSPTAA